MKCSGLTRLSQLLLLWPLVLTSCFEIKEEVWIHPDTSGRVELNCLVPSSVLLMQGGKSGMERTLDAFFRDTPEFSDTRRLVEDLPGGRSRIQVGVSFDRVLDLVRLKNAPATKRLPPAAAQWIGATSIHMEGLAIHFEHRRSLSAAVPMLNLLPTGTLREGSLETTLHLPEAPLQSNAPIIRDSGRTQTWRTSLPDALAQPICINLTMKMPIPWALLGTVALGGAGVLATGAWWWWRRRSARGHQ